METPISSPRIPTGPAGAALIAAGIGVLVIGALTTGAAMSEGLANFLNWHKPAGPLSGKTTVGVLAWLLSWALLRISWKEKEIGLKGVFALTLVLIGLGLVLTFPPVFAALAPGH